MDFAEESLEWDGSFVGEPPADYTTFTKGQFLDDMARRLNILIVNSFVLLPQPQQTFELLDAAEVLKSILPNLAWLLKSWMNLFSGSRHLYWLNSSPKVDWLT